jgi:hypothetical protein
MPPCPEAIRAAILQAVRRRGPGRSICPSEVARAFGGDWRALMPAVRAAAAALQDEGRITVTQKGAPVRADAVRGPIRLALSGGGG